MKTFIDSRVIYGNELAGKDGRKFRILTRVENLVLVERSLIAATLAGWYESGPRNTLLATKIEGLCVGTVLVSDGPEKGPFVVTAVHVRGLVVLSQTRFLDDPEPWSLVPVK